uniref:hypothetical protein n=1 Tax=Dermacoccus nishinomiyaensis TaxID=1274 RepID=UPI00248F1966
MTSTPSSRIWPAANSWKRGSRLTSEDAYAYAKLSRVTLGTNDIDHRARPPADEATRAMPTDHGPQNGGSRTPKKL